MTSAELLRLRCWCSLLRAAALVAACLPVATTEVAGQLCVFVRDWQRVLVRCMVLSRPVALAAPAMRRVCLVSAAAACVALACL